MDPITTPPPPSASDTDVQAERRRRIRWDAQRRVDSRLLAVQFTVCVVSWTILVLLIHGEVSRDGFIASIITGAILAAVTWAMTKLGWNQSGGN